MSCVFVQNLKEPSNHRLEKNDAAALAKAFRWTVLEDEVALAGGERHGSAREFED